MAIIKPGPLLNCNTVDGGLLYACPAGSTAFMQKANNNRSGPMQGALAGTTGSSANFKNLNQQIVNLDGEYETLSTQAAWIAYAATISGKWQLCANCASGVLAKKLFRQYNFNRMLLGLAPVTVPIDPTAFVDPNIFICELGPFVTRPNVASMEGTTLVPPNFYMIANVGLSSRNPFCYLPPDGFGTEYPPGNPIYDFFLAVNTILGTTSGGGTIATNVPCCFFDANGAPGNQLVVEFRIFLPL